MIKEKQTIVNKIYMKSGRKRQTVVDLSNFCFSRLISRAIVHRIVYTYLLDEHQLIYMYKWKMNIQIDKL